jgi:hypothetical protein
MITKLTALALALPLMAVTLAIGADDKPLDGTRFDNIAQLDDVLANKVVLGPGSKGDGVKAIQAALIDMGFALPGSADGAFGFVTARCVKNFQLHARSAFKGITPDSKVGPLTLRALASLAPEPGKRGQKWNVPSPRYDGKLCRIVVVKDEHRTFQFDESGRLVWIAINAHGKPTSPTPSALKHIDVKIAEAGCRAMGQRLWGDPTVFGVRMLGLSGGGQELHGTNSPSQLGTDASHGCVRHFNADILKMYERAQVNDLVAIVDTLRDKHLASPTAQR